MKLNCRQAHNIGEALIDAAYSAVDSGEDQLVVTANDGDIAACIPNPYGTLHYDPEQNFWVQVMDDSY